MGDVSRWEARRKRFAGRIAFLKREKGVSDDAPRGVESHDSDLVGVARRAHSVNKGKWVARKKDWK